MKICLLDPSCLDWDFSRTPDVSPASVSDDHKASYVSYQYHYMANNHSQSNHKWVALFDCPNMPKLDIQINRRKNVHKLLCLPKKSNVGDNFLCMLVLRLHSCSRRAKREREAGGDFPNAMRRGLLGVVRVKGESHNNSNTIIIRGMHSLKPPQLVHVRGF